MGELATGATIAFQVVDLAALRVVVSLPERDLGKITVGQPVRLLSAYDPEHTARGEVARIAPVVDAGSGTFRVTVTIHSGSTLRPGQFVSVRLQVDEHKDVLVVPKVAVVWEDGAPVVYKAAPATDKEIKDEEEPAEGFRFQLPAWMFGGKEAPSKAISAGDSGPHLVAARTRVELSLVDDQWAEIKSGLVLGDEVIVVGQSNLRDGAAIRSAADVKAPPAGSASKGIEDQG